jgi:hypothetical protein
MNLIGRLLFMQMQLRIFHWQTSSFAQHEAFGKAYEALDGMIDEFVEVFQGKRGIVKARDKFVVELHNLSDHDPIACLDECSGFLSGDLTAALDAEKDTDLLNLRDEMLATLSKTKYLLRLK